MKKIMFFALIVLFCAAVTFAGSTGKMDLKVGDEIYACDCGADCPCNTMSLIVPGRSSQENCHQAIWCSVNRWKLPTG